MLSVCLHKLCPKDSFANAFRKVEKCANIVPKRVNNRPGRVQNDLLEASGGALGRQVKIPSKLEYILLIPLYLSIFRSIHF